MPNLFKHGADSFLPRTNQSEVVTLLDDAVAFSLNNIVGLVFRLNQFWSS